VKWPRALLACCVATFGRTGDTQETFTVGGTITNYAPDRAIFVALYASQEGFAKQEYVDALGFKRSELPPDSLRFSFAGLKRGYYMIAAYQDMNGDRVFNKGLFGRPKEPYCMHRPHRGLFAPTFSKCSFLVDRNIAGANLVF
jgi:uncharacterized protein (DUF2141 family)